MDTTFDYLGISAVSLPPRSVGAVFHILLNMFKEQPDRCLNTGFFHPDIHEIALNLAMERFAGCYGALMACRLVDKRSDAIQDELRGHRRQQHAQHAREDEDASGADALLNLQADAHGKPGGDERDGGGHRNGDQLRRIALG